MEEVVLEQQLVKVYRVGEDPVEIPHEEIIYVDRTRMEEDGLCPRKRYLRYHAGGIGYSGVVRNEDLVIGSATHEGLDLLMQGGTLDKAFAVVDDYYENAANLPDYLLPEQKEVLVQDGIHLAKGFVYAFNSVYMPSLLEDYEVLEVEEEINWLLTELPVPISGKKYIVVMSRTDGVVRSKNTKRIWNLSHKTAQDFTEVTVSKLETDPQRFSESMAVWAKYGEAPEGTLYNYFIKGRRSRDEELGISRFTSGLIRPYINKRSLANGDVNVNLLSFVYNWEELDGNMLKTKSLGSTWQRISIYDYIPYMEYLTALENKIVQKGDDYLQKSVVGMVPCFFNEKHVQRWLRGSISDEIQWACNVQMAKEIGIDIENPILDSLMPTEESQCWNWNSKCVFHSICWNYNSIQTLLDIGELEVRQPNHAQEDGGII